ncbi:hypothetical protein F1C58_03945 [Glaciihabitans sp. INWT7]|uniref:hypothetical protein n=1 Tax=Glaciihabitans sp. INWT7 TaxID=2596912 RepID=UPI001623E541|nr:hypothetical protein [Glaciihabitans sp. INWT7]QNE46144.1 hypothetical protein F1C58_03945 [Glaciihabitans sp. INWT7]
MIKSNRRTTGIVFAALIALFSLGMAAPAAMAVEPSQDSVYRLDVNGQHATLTEGATAVFTMQRIGGTAKPGMISPNVVYPGDGAGTITVTASGGVYYWSVAMAIPATSFLGDFSITDTTSGFSGGRVLATSFSGSAPTSKLRGHRYIGSLAGKAFFLGVPVSTTGPNNTVYKYI